MASTSFVPAEIRNVVLLGHTGAGKTALAEALLRRCGVVTRLEADTSVLYATCGQRELNVIDTPGAPELVGQALAVLPAVETALIVVNAAAGIELSTRRLFHAAGEAGLARMIVVNKIDQAPAALSPLVAALKDVFGPELHCINLPAKGGQDVIDCFDHDAGATDFGSVADEHRAMLESSVEIDDATLERYLGGEPIDLPELRRCLVEAMNRGHVVPIVFTAARDGVGIEDLLHILCEEAPSPASRNKRLRKDGELVEIACDPDAPLLGHVFKVTTDPYLGKLAMIRLLQGRLDATTPFVHGAERKPHKAGHVLKVEGRDHPELDAVAYAGDVICLAKIEDLHVGAMIHAPGTADAYTPVTPRYPRPMYALAIEPTSRQDEVKLNAAMARLCEEDPTLACVHDAQTRELVLHGLGEVHLRAALDKLDQRFKLGVRARAPRVAYRETITAPAEGHYRLKKQTGGAGQFAEVFLRIEPLARGAGFEFVDDVYGGAIPRQFIPAVEKGVQDALASGPLAGYGVEDVRVTVYDGKSHAVDSKDIAFRGAAKRAFREAFANARPALLEPILSVEIHAPEQHVGDVTADLKTRRGRVLGVDAVAGTHMASIHAQIPAAELGEYAGRIRGLTEGQGSFVSEPSHFDYVPPQIQKRVTAAFKPSASEED